MSAPFFYGCWPVNPNVKRTIDVGHFNGGPSLLLECTQLGGKRSRQVKIVREWCEFFGAPNPVRELYISTRLPVRLFESVCSHTKLQKFGFKWGPIKDLSPISNLVNLTHLGIGSSSVTSLAPLAGLERLKMLSIENADRLSDYSTLGRLRHLEYLHIDGAPWSSNKPVPIDDLNFLSKLKNLRGLSIGYAKIRDAEWHKQIVRLKKLEQLFLPEPSQEEKALILESLGSLKMHNLSLTNDD